MRNAIWCLALPLVLTMACSDAQDPVMPDDGINPMTVIGCEMDPDCSGGSGDPYPEAHGYWLGSTVTPSQCFSPTGAGINDRDRDGMHDYCEEQLARVFAPALVFSQYDSWTGREPYWAAKYFPDHQNEVRIMYLLSYYGDAGVVDPTLGHEIGCPLLQLLGGTVNFIGTVPNWIASNQPFHVSDENLCQGHLGDSEFVVVDLIYSSITQHWMVQRVFFSAHYGTLTDRSSLVAFRDLEYPDDTYRGYPRVWVAESKHANYPTRRACGSGTLPDDCQGNSTLREVRVRYSPFYNIGSRVVNLVNKAESPGSCVTSASPFRPGVECFWLKEYEFFGWLYGWGENRPQGDGASSYAPFLAARFECHSYTFFGGDRGCTDWGVEADMF
jgi:hypothetical protein